MTGAPAVDPAYAAQAAMQIRHTFRSTGAALSPEWRAPATGEQGGCSGPGKADVADPLTSAGQVETSRSDTWLVPIS